MYDEPPKKIQEGVVNQEEDETVDDPGSDSFDHRLVMLTVY